MNESWNGLGEPFRRRLSRRGVLQAGAAGGLGMLGMAVTGCGDDDSDEPDAGGAATQDEASAPASTGEATEDLGVIKVGIANDAQSGDPAITGGGSWPVTAYAFNSLVGRSSLDGTYVPSLASSYEATDGEGKVWDFHLREGVHFHNGAELVAEDVVYTYQRIRDPEVKATRAGEIEKAVESVEAVDQYTVRFTLINPDVTWPSIAANELMVPHEYAAEAGPDGFAAQPIGSGPFKLVDREINNRIVYETFTDYWNTDQTNGIAYKPAISGAELRVLPEPETRISALLAGEVDIIVNVPASAISRLESESGVTLQYADTGQPLGILINSQAETSPSGNPNPYRDPRVRQALNYAIDLDAIINQLLTGKEQASTGVNPAGLGFVKDLEPYPYDPDKARQLLEEAGYKDGFGGDDAVIFNPGDRWAQSQDVCEAIAGYLREVGIDATVQNLEYATAAAELAKKALYPMAFWGQHPSPETINQAEYFFVNPGVRGLYGGNPDIDALVAEARKTLDDAKRGELYGEMQRIFFEDAGHIFLYNAVYTYATRGDWKWGPGIPTSGEVALWTVTK